MSKTKDCCTVAREKHGADSRAELARVNRIRGQVDGIARMLEERVYCPDIITQIQAVRSALGSLQAAVLASHLQDCVKTRLKKGDEKDSAELLEELVSIFKRT